MTECSEWIAVHMLIHDTYQALLQPKPTVIDNSHRIFVDNMLIRIICRISSATPARYKPPKILSGTSRLPSTLYGSVVHPSPVNIQ